MTGNNPILESFPEIPGSIDTYMVSAFVCMRHGYIATEYLHHQKYSGKKICIILVILIVDTRGSVSCY
jgi:hypothetical protein